MAETDGQITVTVTCDVPDGVTLEEVEDAITSAYLRAMGRVRELA